MLAAESPIDIYFDLDGKPLDGGFVYFGLPNQNPETAPAAVFWDAAGTQPASQPIRTLNGFPSRNGTIAPVYTAGDYSVTVKNRRGLLVNYANSAQNFSNASAVATALAALQAALALAGGGSGSDIVGFLPNGPDSIGRTVQQYLREQGAIWITNFAPPGSAVDGSYDWTAAWVKAAAYAFGGARRPSIRFPSGIFPISSIALDSIRGLYIYGEGGTDPVVANGRTWIYWATGSTATSLLTLKSCSNNVFQDINFFSNNLAGKVSMLEFQCNSSTTSAPLNKFASTSNLFENCAFVVSPGNPMSLATVNVKSALNNVFRRCPIYGTNAIKLGKDTDVDPVSGDPTIPDGRAVSTVFEDCLIFGNILLERVLGATFSRPYFGANSVPFAANSYRIAYWQMTGAKEVRNLTVQDLICDTANVTHNVPVWFPPITSPAVEPSGEFTNCQLNGAGTMIDLASGNWVVRSNKFIGENKPGVTNWIGIRLNDGVKKFEAGLNDYEGLMALNTASVVAESVVDIRTSFEDRRLLLARGRATDLALSSNNFTQVLSRTLDHCEGGLVELSYDITLASLVDSAYIARIRVDGVTLAGSISQATSNVAGAKTMQLTFGPKILKLPATDLTSSRVIELQIQQVSGASFATVRGDSFANANTFALMRVVA